MKKENKFTPGPWKIEVYQNELEFVDEQRNKICSFGSNSYRDWPNEHNETLMLHSPDLLAACESALAMLESEMDDADELEHDMGWNDVKYCVLCQLREAVKKAKGE